MLQVTFCFCFPDLRGIAACDAYLLNVCVCVLLQRCLPSVFVRSWILREAAATLLGTNLPAFWFHLTRVGSSLTMRKTHPAIAELKRRNRAAGQRLAPINARVTNIAPRPPSHPRTSMSAQPTASTVRSYPHAQDAPSRTSSRFASTANVGGCGGSHTTTTTTATSMATNRSSGRAKYNGVSRTPVHHMPSKPQSTLLQARARTSAAQEDRASLREGGSLLPGSDAASRGTEVQATARDSMVSQDTLFDSSSQLWGNAHCNRMVKTTTSSAPNADANEEEEVASLECYKHSEAWNHKLSQQVLDVLEGERMEDPFTTDLWTRPLKGVTETFSGYYACVRCHVPLVAPTYQILYSVRGIAAFSRMNTQAVEVRVGGVAAPTSSSSAQRRDSLELKVHCHCCGGFLGLLAPSTEIELEAGARSVFAVNSCCLEFVKGARTQCRLDEIYGEDEDDVTSGVAAKASRGSIGIDFDDPGIFEM
ncbi:uncharacterized protein Tco025E_09426 [Trypanosoma conorhini]|uniref:Uncharacterized protein n=1 Tax=Trypanosoma conorhini TaxID=83891 RepID=A0A3R7KML8_9TRYP|nr:uncharacterized protein Tco025E_09426 [Trypanosoma conorhini]RNE97548.1 hypothetical protein Tco025E_09426 [Trypanosoma conorhini]